MVLEPEVPSEPHPLADMDSSLTFASPSIYYQVPIDVTAGWHTRVHTHTHYICMYVCVRTHTHTMYACMHARTHTCTHRHYTHHIQTHYIRGALHTYAYTPVERLSMASWCNNFSRSSSDCIAVTFLAWDWLSEWTANNKWCRTCLDQ